MYRALEQNREFQKQTHVYKSLEWFCTSNQYKGKIVNNDIGEIAVNLEKNNMVSYKTPTTQKSILHIDIKCKNKKENG